MTRLELLHRPGAPTLAAHLVLRQGSRLDPAAAAGRQQLLAGMLTRGCATLGAEAVADLVENRGAQLRCEAGDDLIVLALRCASEDADPLLPLLLTMLEAPQIEASQVERERHLNLQTLQRLQEDPFHRCHERLRRQLYGHGPYGHDPLGVAGDLATISRQDLAGAALDLPADDAVLVLAGDPDSALLENITERFSRWRAGAPQRQPLEPQGPLRLATVELETEQAVVMLGFRTVPLSHPDLLPLQLLQVHLAVGMSSRLFQQLREERGLAYEIGVDISPRQEASPCLWYLSTGADRLAEAIDALEDEWQRVLSQPLTDEDLRLARAKLRGQDCLASETPSQRADRLALLLGHGLPADHHEQSLRRLEQLGAEDLRAAANRWLNEPQLSVCGPGRSLGQARPLPR
jgi:predicted Zn-dependent peptidase